MPLSPPPPELPSAPPALGPRTPLAQDTKPIFASQRAVAESLFARIRDCLQERGRPLATFTDGVDFRILTALFNTLKEQTVRRLVGLAAADQLPNVSNDNAKELVMLYGAGVDQHASFERLRTSARSNPNRLHVIIADEAHWGATAGGWNSYYVNDAHGTTGDHQRVPRKQTEGELLDLPNVVVLLVSATPFNLLSSKSRVPIKASAEHGDDYHVVSWDEQMLAFNGLPAPDSPPLLRCRLVTWAPYPAEGTAASVEYVAAAAAAVDDGRPPRLVRAADPATKPVMGIFAAAPAAASGERPQYKIALQSADGNSWQWLCTAPASDVIELTANRERALPFRLNQKYGYSVLVLEASDGRGCMTVTEDGRVVLDKPDNDRRLVGSSSWRCCLTAMAARCTNRSTTTSTRCGFVTTTVNSSAATRTCGRRSIAA